MLLYLVDPLHNSTQEALRTGSMSGCGGNGSCSSGGGGCQQQQSTTQQPGSFGSWARRHGVTADDAPKPHASTKPEPLQDVTCMKCKAAPAVTTIRQNEPYCHACIETGVCQKARVSTKALGLISKGDSALLALSGGAASAALLYVMAGMQAPLDAVRPARGKVPYILAILHIDCSIPKGPISQSQQAAAATIADGSSADEQQGQLHAQLAALTVAAGYAQQPLLLHLSDVFCSAEHLQQLLAQQQQAHVQAQEQPNGTAPTHAEPQQPQQPQQQRHQQQNLQRLQELVSAISDPTGREDLITHLRDQLLLRAASVLGCSRLLRGDCASRVAVKVIAEAAKGRGFSLPADIQNIDGRLLPTGGPAVLQPLREITHKELREVCKYKGLPLLQDSSGSNGSSGGGLGSSSSSNVNVLAERFVREMEGSIPASIYTIIRTAAHLEPFGFTDAAALVPQAAEAMKKHHSHKPKAQQQQQQQQTEGQGATGNSRAALQWQLCSICRAPLPAQLLAADSAPAPSANGVPSSNASAECAAAEGPSSAGDAGSCTAKLCYSCNRQILQQVKPAPWDNGAVIAAPAQGLSLEEKMQRLKQLLPPGMLLDSDSGDEAEC